MERIFSKGRLILPYTRNKLSAESVRALLCVGDWSRADLIGLDILRDVAAMDDLPGDEEAFLGASELE